MKIDDRIKDALEATGLPWSADYGSKHIKVKVAGRLACVLPVGASARRGSINRSQLNSISQIKAIARSMKESET